VPYHLACQGPSLNKCAETQRGTNFCHPGCGAEVCVQPGTSEAALRAYLKQWDSTWLDKYSTNDYKPKYDNMEASTKEDPMIKALSKLIDNIFG